MPENTSPVTIDAFVPEGAGTRVTTTFDPEGTHSIEMQRQGWQAILDSYAAFATRAG